MKNWLFTIIFLLNFAPGESFGHTAPYLMFEPSFRVNEVMMAGIFPLPAHEALMRKYASDYFENEFLERFGTPLINEDEIDDLRKQRPKWSEAHALLKDMMDIANWNLGKDNGNDFFESREPHFSVGPIFSGLEHKGQPIRFGLLFKVTEYYYDSHRTQMLKSSGDDRGFTIAACVVDLQSGDLQWCRVIRETDRALLRREGYFNKEYYLEILDELLSGDQHLTYSKWEGAE